MAAAGGCESVWYPPLRGSVSRRRVLGAGIRGRFVDPEGVRPGWDQAVAASKAAIRIRLYTAVVILNQARLRSRPM